MLKFNKVICITLSVSMSCISVGDSFGQSFNPLDDLMNGIVSGLSEGLTGVSSYRTNPVIIKYVYPYVTDRQEFYKFMDKYMNKNNLTEKDGVDMLIQLGILQNRPDWISADGMKRINKYYPGIVNRKKATFLLDQSSELVQLASYSDAERSAQAEEVLRYAPIVLLSVPATIAAVNFALAVTAIGLTGILLYKVVENLNKKGQQELMQAQDSICNSGNVSCVDAPEAESQNMPEIYMPDKPGGRNCACNCRAGDSNKPSTYQFYTSVGKTCSSAAVNACNSVIQYLRSSNVHHVQALCTDGNRYSASGRLAR